MSTSFISQRSHNLSIYHHQLGTKCLNVWACGAITYANVTTRDSSDLGITSSTSWKCLNDLETRTVNSPIKILHNNPVYTKLSWWRPYLASMRLWVQSPALCSSTNLQCQPSEGGNRRPAGQGHLEVHNNFEAILGYMGPCLKISK